MTVVPGPPGWRYSSGRFEGSALVVTRDDGLTETVLPGVVLIRGTLVDNGEGWNNIIFPED